MSLENGYFKDKRSYESYGSALDFVQQGAQKTANAIWQCFLNPPDHESHYSWDGYLKGWGCTAAAPHWRNYNLMFVSSLRLSLIFTRASSNANLNHSRSNQRRTGLFLLIETSSA